MNKINNVMIETLRLEVMKICLQRNLQKAKVMINIEDDTIIRLGQVLTEPVNVKLYLLAQITNDYFHLE